MFQNASSFTANSCTMNEVAGNQENHFTTNNDHRQNCDNQNSHHTTNSHNTSIYDDDQLDADVDEAKNPGDQQSVADLEFPFNRQNDFGFIGTGGSGGYLGAQGSHGPQPTPPLSLAGGNNYQCQPSFTAPQDQAGGVAIPIRDSSEEGKAPDQTAETGSPTGGSGRSSPSQGFWKSVIGKTAKKHRDDIEH